MTTQFSLGFAPTRKSGDPLAGAHVLVDDFLAIEDHIGSDGSFSGAYGYEAFVNGANFGGGAAAEVGGVLQMDTTGTTSAGNSGTLFVPGPGFVFEVGRKAEFVSRFKTNRVDAEIYAGFSSLPGAGAVGTEPSSFVGFLTDGDGTLYYKTKNAGTGTNVTTGIALVASTYVDVGLKWDGVDTVSFYVNGSRVARSTVNIPTGVALTPLLAAGATTANQTIVDFDNYGALMQRT